MQRVTVNPEICNGKPTIRGLRITVKTILEYLAAGDSVENILKAYPVLEAEDIKAALDFAAKSMDRELTSFKTVA
ncbi:MAG: DUF433 domain-containing protein [Bacteroidetes bacterium]|nr:DUF433 domain-containing protein [Bacteroidota bacterium]